MPARQRRGSAGSLPSAGSPALTGVWLAGGVDSSLSMRCCPSEADVPADQAAADGRERLRLASLDSTDRMEPSVGLLKCPRASDRVIIELHSGQVYPDRCRALRCRFCLPLQARRRCLAITLAQPTRMITMTLAADEIDQSPCATARTRIGLMSRNLKRMGYQPGEWTWTIEQNPNETGFHAHMLQRGPSIPQRKLQEASKRASGGIVWIKRIERKGIWTSRYGLKGFGADGYGLKGFSPNGNADHALKINNFHLEHHSRGFFAYEGEIFSPRQMERMALHERYGGKPTSFVATVPSEVDNILESPRLRRSLIRGNNEREAAKLRALI